MQKTTGFSRLSSVRTSDEFHIVFKTGRFVSNGEMVLYTRKNGYPHSRLGVSVSGKSGNSIKRHRFIRLMREIFRLHQHELRSGTDYVIVVRKHFRFNDVTLLNYRNMEKQILSLLSRAGVFHPKQKPT